MEFQSSRRAQGDEWHSRRKVRVLWVTAAGVRSKNVAGADVPPNCSSNYRQKVKTQDCSRDDQHDPSPNETFFQKFLTDAPRWPSTQHFFLRDLVRYTKTGSIMSAIDRRREVSIGIFVVLDVVCLGRAFFVRTSHVLLQKAALKGQWEGAAWKSIARIRDWWCCREILAPARLGNKIYDRRKYQITRDTIRNGSQLRFCFRKVSFFCPQSPRGSLPDQVARSGPRLLSSPAD